MSDAEKLLEYAKKHDICCTAARVIPPLVQALESLEIRTRGFASGFESMLASTAREALAAAVRESER